MEISLFVKILLIININFIFVNGEITDIYLNNSNTFKFNGNRKFCVKSEKENNLSNYLKIQIDSLYNNDNNDNQFVISYYQQDSSFEERKQFSQSFTNSTFIWLNKNQINKDFYFSVECSIISNCLYNLTFYKKDYAELNLGDIYNYYVTEENKNMSFLIKVNCSKYINLYPNIYRHKVTIWSRGGKSIFSILKPHSFNSILNDNYQAYLSVLSGLIKEYFLKIEGNVGDLINVGSLIFDEKNICPIMFKDIGTEITGFFKKNLFELNCFKFSNASLNSFNDFIYDFNFHLKGDRFFKKIDNYTLVCYRFNKYLRFDEYLFSLQYINNGKKILVYFLLKFLGKIILEQ